MSDDEDEALTLSVVPLRDCPDPNRCGRDRQLLCALVTHLRERVSDLETETLVDALTRVGNRRAFDCDLEAAVAFATRHSEPLTLLIVDIDHFKEFNDRFGHPAGDNALATVASALSRGRRRSDKLSRIGGEEFGLIMLGAAASAGVRIAERLREEVAQLNIRLTVSVGVAVLAPQETPAEIFSRADRALYSAKGNGRNRVAVGLGQTRRWS